MVKRKRIFLNIVTVLMFLSAVFFMTGCRESMVIQQIIYDQASEDIDFQNELKTAQSNDDSQNEDEDMPEEKTDKSDKKSEEKHVASQLGKTKNNGSAIKTSRRRMMAQQGLQMIRTSVRYMITMATWWNCRKKSTQS